MSENIFAGGGLPQKGRAGAGGSIGGPNAKRAGGVTKIFGGAGSMRSMRRPPVLPPSFNRSRRGSLNHAPAWYYPQRRDAALNDPHAGIWHGLARLARRTEGRNRLGKGQVARTVPVQPRPTRRHPSGRARGGAGRGARREIEAGMGAAAGHERCGMIPRLAWCCCVFKIQAYTHTRTRIHL